MNERKKIWKNICLLLFPFVIGVILLFALPFDKRFAYNFTHDNCMGQSGFIYDRLHHNTTPVDIALLGTSHTLDAVSDKRMEETLHRSGDTTHVLNMGYCRFGRNMHYALFQELLKYKDPKYIIIEVTEKENRDGHMDFAYMADAGDVLFPQLIFNDNILEDWWKALTVRFESYRQKLLGKYHSPVVRTQLYADRQDASIADEGDMQYQKETRLDNYEYSTGFGRWFYNQISFAYLDEIHALAQENDVKIFFLYLPQYASIPQPEEVKKYEEYGTVLYPPEEIYSNPQNWKDIEHMNSNGSRLMSDWLADNLSTFATPPR